MATSYSGMNLSGKQNMLLDTLALTIVPFFGSFIFGVFSFEVNIFGGYNFSSPIWTVAGAEISAALLVVLFGLAWILATNAIDGNDYEPDFRRPDRFDRKCPNQGVRRTYGCIVISRETLREKAGATGAGSTVERIDLSGVRRSNSAGSKPVFLTDGLVFYAICARYRTHISRRASPAQRELARSA